MSPPFGALKFAWPLLAFQGLLGGWSSAAASNQAHAHTPAVHTRAHNPIRGVLMTAPAQTTLLAQSLRSLRGMPLTPPVREVARQRIAAIADQHGWGHIDITLADHLDEHGQWAITVRTNALPLRADDNRARLNPKQVPLIRTPASATGSDTRSTMPAVAESQSIRASRQFAAWARSDHYRVLIARQTRTLFLKQDDAVLEFPVAVGRRGAPTPTGGFTVQAIAQQPTWYPTKNIRARAAARGRELPRSIPPGPGNPLGNWFVAIGNSIGIHGTNAPRSIGGAVSSGCVRMQNRDIDVVAQSLRAGDGVLVVDALDARASVPVPPPRFSPPVAPLSPSLLPPGYQTIAPYQASRQ